MADETKTEPAAATADAPATPAAPAAPAAKADAKADAKAAKADAKTDNGSTEEVSRLGSRDRLTDIKAAQGPLQPTALDAMGVERIVGPAVDDNWRPAATEPHPDAIAHAERVAEADKARRDERLGATQVAAENLGGTEKPAQEALAAERA